MSWRRLQFRDYESSEDLLQGDNSVQSCKGVKDGPIQKRSPNRKVDPVREACNAVQR